MIDTTLPDNNNDAALKALFVKAKGILEEPDRWTTGTYFRRSRGQVCALGAIYAAAGQYGDDLDHSYSQDWENFGGDERTRRVVLVEEAEHMLNTCVEAESAAENIVEFNDNYAQTVADVTHFFDCAINKMREKMVP